MDSKNGEEQQSFEFYMKELDRILSEMENSGIGQLESMIVNFEYGSQLIEKCNKILREAELRVQKISSSLIKERHDEDS